MPHHVETDIAVPRFAFDQDDEGKRRLSFPRAELKHVEGRSGGVTYGVDDGVFEELVGRLDMLRWTAGTASLGSAFLKDDAGKFEIRIGSVEIPQDVVLTRAASGLELQAPHVTMKQLKLSLKGPFGRSSAPPASPSEREMMMTGPLPPPELMRQERLRFLDSLAGRIALTIKVVLDLPVLGKRTLDQQLRVPIEQGSINFRGLEESLDWLEGRFLDFDYERNKLALQFKVPIFGKSRDLVVWQLDEDAQKLAAFGRVPVRSLTEIEKKKKNEPEPADKDKRQILQALAIEGIDIALSLLAPRTYEVGGGVIMFGGDDAPGLMNLKITGGLRDKGPGKLSGGIGRVDTTIKDLRIGPVLLSADRLELQEIDELVVTFDGFRPIQVDLSAKSITATGLQLRLGGDR
ncbi:MAG TPA: hypothetical protein VGM90_38075 [Kofleriaceae bacterium]|jgi:hypothetical protein